MQVVFPFSYYLSVCVNSVKKYDVPRSFSVNNYDVPRSFQAQKKRLRNIITFKRELLNIKNKNQIAHILLNTY